jgi:hypothetical protein
VNQNVATMIARYGTPKAVRQALAEFNLPAPRSDADARRALVAAAEAVTAPVTFSFSLDAGPAASGTPQKKNDMVSAAPPAPAEPAGMSQADLYSFLAREQHSRHLDLLSRTVLGLASLPFAAASPEKARAAAEDAERRAILDGEAYLRRVEAQIAERRRRELLSKSSAGRACLSAEDAEDAARRR